MSSVAEAPIVLDPVSHIYSRGLVTYESVTRVIKAVLPTDYSAVDPAVLENARLRGVFCDTMFCAWLNGKNPVIPAGTDRDWVDRLQALITWWKKTMAGTWQTQVTVSDETNLIAGTADLRCAGHGKKGMLDIKVVSELQPSYALQLGAYASMDDADEVAIIHVTKDRVRLVVYDPERCKADWKQCLEWYITRKRLLGRRA